MTVIDCAGGAVGGSRRFLDELEQWLSGQPGDFRVIGNGHGLSGRWMVGRELRASRLGPAHVVALNNVSFVAAGTHRTVLVRNALHFLRPGELEDRRRQLRGEMAKGLLVRLALKRADRVIVPSTSMAGRVTMLCPEVASRLDILPHPVRPRTIDPAVRALGRTVVCPVVDGPHKRLQARLGDAIAVLTEIREGGGPHVRLEVTLPPDEAQRQGLPDLPWISYLGLCSTAQLSRHLAGARVIFYPVEVESFGYPLAEARVNRQPVVAPDNALTREVAADALVGYQPGDRPSLRSAFDRAFSLDLARLDANPFDPSTYFARLFSSGALIG